MVALEHRPNAVSDQGSSVLTACSACPGINWEKAGNRIQVFWRGTHTECPKLSPKTS